MAYVAVSSYTPLVVVTVSVLVLPVFAFLMAKARSGCIRLCTLLKSAPVMLTGGATASGSKRVGSLTTVALM